MRGVRRAAAALAVLLAVLALPAGAEPRVVYRAAREEGKKRVALTFDDGPHPRYTPEILDILGEYGVSATFFAVGANAECHPEIVKRAIAAGHEIGNHTFNHYNAAKLSPAALREDIDACDELLARLGASVRYFRPPEGVCNDAAKRICAAHGYTVVLWSVDTRDWAHTPVAEIVRNVKENTRDGSIILMHDFIGKNSPTPAALRQIIPMLQAAGFTFVTVSQLLGE